jgi:hypothetical protein
LGAGRLGVARPAPKHVHVQPRVHTLQCTQSRRLGRMSKGIMSFGSFLKISFLNKSFLKKLILKKIFFK